MQVYLLLTFHFICCDNMIIEVIVLNVISIKLDSNGLITIEKIDDFKDDLASIYNLLECSSFESVPAYYLRETFPEFSKSILLVDEEGALKESPVFNPVATVLFCNDPRNPIVGNAIVCNVNVDKGELEGFSDNDTNTIMKLTDSIIDSWIKFSLGSNKH